MFARSNVQMPTITSTSGSSRVHRLPNPTHDPPPQLIDLDSVTGFANLFPILFLKRSNDLSSRARPGIHKDDLLQPSPVDCPVCYHPTSF